MLLTDKSLAEIALECGLADQPHLTKTFRRIVGMSPGAWRRARRSVPHPPSDFARVAALPANQPSSERSVANQKPL
jgi:AraC-like DNA-binding protein